MPGFRVRGFTLVEMIVVIVIGGILSVGISGLITRPLEGYATQGNRALLVDSAETALQQMTREIRRALPNSVRVGCANQCIEILRILDGGRYRIAGAGNTLDFSLATDTFDALGVLQSEIDAPGVIDDVGSTSQQQDCLDGTVDCLVIYNTGTDASEISAYDSENIAAITSANSTSISFDNSGDVPTFNFPLSSPGQRFFVVDSPITFYCDTVTGQITRYQNYAIQSPQPIDPMAAPLNAGQAAIVTENVGSCSFTYSPGTLFRSGLVTLDIGFTRRGDVIRLIQQIHVSNVP